MKPRYHCIFCFKTDLEVPFSVEHLIPDCIYGLLYFDNIVCKSCNDRFGYNVDLQILRLPEIANAFKELGYTKEYEIILKNNYNIKGKLGDGTEIKVYIKNGNIVLPHQKLADGSEIIPEDIAAKNILTKLKRKNIKEQLGQTDKYIEDRFTEFWQEYEKLDIDQPLISDELDYGLKKRSDEIKAIVEPKKEANILPLIGKICYEMGYLISGERFYQKDNLGLAKSLRKLAYGLYDKYEEIEVEKIKLIKVNGFDFLREKPSYDDYQYFHTIKVEFAKDTCVFHISFFGKIQYMLITPGFSDSVLNSLTAQFNLPDIDMMVIKMFIKDKVFKYGFRTSKGFVEGN